MFLDPKKEEKRQEQVKNSIETYDKKFGDLDMEQSYEPLFELLWYSQMPCIDVKGITSQEKDEASLLKKCYWKNKPVPCNAIFQKRPTDRGMCCSFNMDKANAMLKDSKYTKVVSRRQSEEKKNGFEMNDTPEWFKKKGEPKPESGRNKGLSLVLDRHSDKLSPSTVMDNFNGFLAIIDDKDKYPLTSATSLIASPGHETNIEINAVNVESLDEIRKIHPKRRNCFFSDEYELDMHQSYSQSNCLLECKVKFTYECLKTCTISGTTCDCGNMATQDANSHENNGSSCIPWFYPVDDRRSTEMCNPWNTLKFNKIMNDDIPDDQCLHCLSDCSTTVYTTNIAYSAFQKCDHTNTGTNLLCDMVNGELNPAPWTMMAQNEYIKASPNDSLPWYLETDLTKVNVTEAEKIKFPNQRSKMPPEGMERSVLFKIEMENNPTYDAFERDIGFVNIFFGRGYSTRYIKKNRMSGYDFLSQVGGSVGLAMGISIISLVEILYWFTLRWFND